MEDSAIPKFTFSGEMSLYLGDLTLELREEGGHCPGELSIFIPEHRVLLTGDNVFNGRTPYVGNADIPKWLQILTRLHALDPEVVIPGHGEAGTREILLKQREWLETFLGLAHEGAKAGTSAEEVADKVIAALNADPARRAVIIAASTTFTRLDPQFGLRRQAVLRDRVRAAGLRR